MSERVDTLEITIQHKRGNAWPVVIEHGRSGVFLPVRSEGVLHLDQTELLAQVTPRDYGTLLGQAFFRDEIRDAFVRALANSGEDLRVLLYVEADDLRTLRWERLCAPVDIGWDFLALNGRVPYSLYLPSLTDRRFPPIGRRDLRALVLAASPEGLEQYRLDHFDVESAVSSVRAALGECDVLATVNGAVGPPTLEALCKRITAEQYTLLHIVCHGQYQRGEEETVLYLADAQNQVDPVPDQRLLEWLARLRGARGLPHLAFLATCESASPEAEGALGGLAQRLVRELGMPAVVAMTDKVSLDTAQALAGAFYRYLRKHGEVDRALVEACAGLAERHDITVPALYSRLGGRPLFSDALDRQLTNDDVAYGLSRAEELLPERGPVLKEELGALAATLQRTLDAEPEALSEVAREEREDALAEVNNLCEEVFDLTFNALALGREPPAYDGRCPFPGLVAFGARFLASGKEEEDDRNFFFGREKLVEQVERKLGEYNFLPILGPSGCGKSSLVLAGLIPKLQDQEPDLQMAYLTPGSNPVAQLDASLARVQDQQAVLVVDQFEELFTLTQDKGQRQAFINQLLAQAEERLVVITMRADFWGDCASYPALKEMMQTHQKLIAPMTTAELRSAMEQQARAVGLRFEADLSHTILDDVWGEPGAMPLLQHALQELWKRRHGRWLRAKEYRALGGVQQAIGRTADAIYAELSHDERERMRDIFVRLTRLDEEAVPGEERRDTRRRVRFGDLVPAGSESAPTKALVARLADAKLVVTSVNEVTDIEEVEVAHEALIRYWQRLRDWLDEDRDMLRLRQKIGQDAREWEAGRRQDELLPRWNAQLEEAVVLSRQPRFVLSELEREYLDACVALRDREEAEKEAQRQRELQQERARRRAEEERAREAEARRAAEEQARQEAEVREQEQAEAAANLHKRAVWLAGAVVLVALLAVATGVFGVQSNNNAKKAIANELTAQAESSRAIANKRTAEAERDRADRQAQIALARQLAAQAVTSIERKLDAELSLLLAVEAVQATRDDGLPHVVEAEDALRRALASAPIMAVLHHGEGWVSSVTFSPDGTRLATAGSDGTIRLWSMADPQAEPSVLSGHENKIMTMVFSRKGQRLATADYDGTVHLWEVATAEELPVLHHEGLVEAIAFSPDGTRLATQSGGTVRLWNIVTGEELTDLSAYDKQNVYSAALSPDGQRLATADYDGHLRVWDVDTGEELSVLQEVGRVSVVTFSSDGTRLATTGPDRPTRVWDVEKGKELAILHHEAGGASVVIFSSDGTRLATIAGSSIRAAAVRMPVFPTRVWEVATGKELAVLRHGGGSVRTFTFSPDGFWLATTGDDGTVRLWDVDAGKELAVLSHGISINAVAFSPDGTRLATQSGGTVRLWDVDTGIEPTILRNKDAVEKEEPVAEVLFSPDGARVATVLKGNPPYRPSTARLWDAVTAEELANLGSISTVTFSPDSSRLATIDTMKPTVRLWDATTGEAILDDGGTVMAIAFSPDSSRLATADTDNGTARLWDAATGKELAVLYHGEGWVSSVTFSPDETRLTTRSGDTVRLWDAATGKELAVLSHEGSVNAITFSPDGTRLATAGEDGTTRLWDAATGKELAVLSHEDSVYGVEFSPDGARLVTAGEDGTARLWDAATGKELAVLSHEGSVNAITFSPDGTRLAIVGEDGTARLVGTASGKALAVLRHEQGSVNAVEFSPDGTRLATRSGDTVRLWDAATGKELTVLSHEGSVNAITFSPDGTRLATAGKDGTARLVDTASGEALVVLRHEQGSINAVTFSPDGTRLATAGEDGTARLWRVSVDNLKVLACHILSRNMIETEWHQYFGEEREYRETCPDLPGPDDGPAS
jgi:WD40 repeat protein/energy-coupling factor transporter ATP-binding protein EcfA2